MSFFLEVVQSAFSPMVLFYMFAGVAAGICIGALPGLTATMGVALLLPLTFGMDATSGILMLLGIYVGAIYGGSISAILLHTPGTPASAATAIDGYQFSKRGEAGRALGIATLSSYIGGVVSCLCLWLISPQLAKLALKFSSAEFFLLAVFGLCIIANISGENMAKGLICGFLGILTATVGIDSVTSYIRFTDNANLLSGIQYIPVMIGLFAMSQAFETIEDIYSTDEIDATVTRLLPTKEDVKTMFRVAPVTGLIGTIIGIIPGAGADIGSFVGYNTARGMSKHPELFGKGSPEAVAASEGGNNGVTGGAMIPMLTLGVPGDAVAAIMIGALTIQGLTPGPDLFVGETAKMTYTFFAGFVLTQFAMLGIGLLGCRIFAQISRLSDAILIPAVSVLCVVGSYAIHKNFLDVVIMMIFGVLGYLLRKFDLNNAAVVLALILGPIGEKGLRRSLALSKGSPAILFSTPVCWVLIVLCIFGILSPIFMNRMEKMSMEKAGEQ